MRLVLADYTKAVISTCVNFVVLLDTKSTYNCDPVLA